MRNISNAFRNKLAENRGYLIGYADITLSSGTVLALSNNEIWTDGIQTEDAVSNDNEFSALGSTIIGSATVIINNIYDTYSQYDFTNAKVVLSLGVQIDATNLEVVKLGTYTVDEAIYNGATITLNVLDNMEQFDRPYVTNLAYPATLDAIVRDACLKCGVTLGTYNFPHKNHTVRATKPDSKSTTFRDVIGWAAAIAGCFARCDVNGRLELKWFDQSSFETLWEDDLDGGQFDSGEDIPYPSGDTASGGTFNPWNTGYEYDAGDFTSLKDTHYLSSLYSEDIEIDDAVITGVKLLVKDESEGSSSTIDEYLSGTEDYVIEVANNEFITTATAPAIVNWLGSQLNGLRFRRVNVSHLMNPSIEAGDIGLVIDHKKRRYPILITRTNFAIAGTQTTVCGASTPSRNSATRYSSQTKSYVASRKLLNREQTIREQQIEALSRSLAEASGLYSTIQATSSGNIYYLHDKPTLEESKIVWKMTTDAWGVTTNYNGEHPERTVWNAGMTVDGDTIVRILSATGINADWIYSGTLTLGGSGNANGVLKILNSSGTRVGLWNNTALYLGNISNSLSNANTRIGANGAITTKTLTANDYIYVNGNEDSYIKIPFTPEGFTTAVGYVELGNKGLYVSASYSYSGSTGVRHVRIGSSQLSPDGRLIYEIAPVTVSNSRYFDRATKRVSLWDDTITIERNNGYPVEIRATYSAFDTEVEVKKLTVSGTKSRNVATKDYGNRLLYCYETPSPLFGDVGEGTIGEDGKCYIQIDSIFAETVSLNQYQVFLQKYGNGDCWVSERKSSYFIVEGTPNLAFGWELKAKQSDFDQFRLDKNEGRLELEDYSDYAENFLNHIAEINKERESVING